MPGAAELPRFKISQIRRATSVPEFACTDGHGRSLTGHAQAR
jgi:hypothetical protein